MEWTFKKLEPSNKIIGWLDGRIISLLQRLQSVTLGNINEKDDIWRARDKTGCYSVKSAYESLMGPNQVMNPQNDMEIKVTI